MEGEKKVVRAGQKIQPSKKYPSLSLIGVGYVKRYHVSPDSAPSIQSIYGPGDIFPLTPLFKLLFDQEIHESPTSYHYGAMTDVELHSIDNKTFLKNVNSDPTLYKDLLAQAGRRLQSNIQQLENAGLKDTHRRVCHQLAFLGRHFGVLHQHGIDMHLPLTPDDLAALLNLPIDDVEASFKRLREAHLIEGEGKLRMPDLQALVLEAYS